MGYKIIEKHGSIEIREYPHLLLAEVEIVGTESNTLEEGFFILANYFFGNNTAQRKLPSNAPISRRSEKISITTPVFHREHSKDTWVVALQIPDSYSFQIVPIPNNVKITLVQKNNVKYAVVRFRGRASEKNRNKNLKILDDFILKKNLITKKNKINAYYSPPWTLPFLRRNEIYYELASFQEAGED